MYRYLIFDLDGTLTESGEGIMNSAEYAFKAMGRQVPDRTELRRFVGPPLKESFPRYGMDEAETEEAIRQFRVYFADRGWLENKPYEGIIELCGQLKESGYKLIVATSKIEFQAVRIMDHFGLKPYFLDVIGSDDASGRFSKADVVRFALNKYGIAPDSGDAVMIGDRCYDVEGARECGLDTIGVSYGYGTRRELEDAGAKVVADSVEELGRYLQDGRVKLQ